MGLRWQYPLLPSGAVNILSLYSNARHRARVEPATQAEDEQ